MSGQGDNEEITLWPSFILHVKVTPYFYKENGDNARPQCFASVFTSEVTDPVGFDPDSQQHLVSFNTSDDGVPDEYNATNEAGLHLLAPYGIFAHSKFLTVSDLIHDSVILNITYVHMVDYAGAYDAIDCWRGNRWETACGRAGTDFLDNYGGFPSLDESGDDATGSSDAGDDPPSINEEPIAIPEDDPGDDPQPGSGGYAKLTDHTGGRLTDDSFLVIEAYPIRSSQDSERLI